MQVQADPEQGCFHLLLPTSTALLYSDGCSDRHFLSPRGWKHDLPWTNFERTGTCTLFLGDWCVTHQGVTDLVTDLKERRPDPSWTTLSVWIEADPERQIVKVQTGIPTHVFFSFPEREKSAWTGAYEKVQEVPLVDVTGMCAITVLQYAWSVCLSDVTDLLKEG